MLKIRRAVAAAGASVLLALALAGCADSGDEAAVRAALDEELELIAELDEAFVNLAVSGMGDELAAYGVSPEEFVGAYLEGFSYEVGAVEVGGDAATAEVTMTCKSVFEYVAEVQEAAIALTEGGSLEGADPESVGIAMGEAMVGAWSEVEPSECEPISVALERLDGKWAVSDDSASEITRALLGH